MARLLSWVLALLLSLVLAATLVPARYLSMDQLGEAVRQYRWGSYPFEDLPYALGGALLLAAAGGLLGGWLILATSSRRRLNDTLRFLTHSASLGGLSSLQSVVAAATTLLVWSWFDLLDQPGWVLWIPRISIIVMLGIPLAAEVALRYAGSSERGWFQRLRSAGGMLQEQSAALAGRLAWIALSTSLLLYVMMRQAAERPGPDELAKIPTGILPIAVAVVLLAFLLWLAGGLVRTGRFNASIEPESADPEQCEVTQPGRPWLVWALVLAVLLWPVVMTWFADGVRPLSVRDAPAPPESPMLPWTTDWGSSRQGQDLHAVLYHAWRGAVHAGVVAAALAATVGVLWRFGAGYLSSSARRLIEISLFRVPPILPFLAALGLIITFWRQSMDYRAVGVAIALVLLPQSLRLMRIDCGKMPTTIACQVLLGTLLALGWTSAPLGFIGLMSFDQPTFSDAFRSMSAGQGNETLWMLHRGLALLLIAVALNLIALGAIVRAYNLPRELTRLRG